MASPIEWASMMTALGELAEHRMVREYIHDGGTPELSWANFPELYDDPSWELLPVADVATVYLAELLYSGIPDVFDLGWAMSVWNAEQWHRALEALTIKKGVDKELVITPGDWKERIG